MYATLCVKPGSKRSGKLIGTHQKLDKAARQLLGRNLLVGKNFPTITEILRFEGMQGPDGLKRKSPGVDEPEHFIIPEDDDGVLVHYMDDHHYNLVQALKKGDRVRASFEAAWLAHVITDGLTPAHHYPFREVRDELVGDADYVKIFGVELKGMTKQGSFAETMRTNWLYFGAGGLMTKHVAYEYGVAYIITPVPLKHLMPKDFTKQDAENADYKKSFYESLERVNNLKMYKHFLEHGWTAELAIETREVLIPEIVRAITLAWASAANQAKKELTNGKK
ncbi:MAG: hypothetical protein K6F57_01835 [Candidatus Saccharibacteria bacterium]|nr:hypothetical protein [Candidatus Saccharibacteria bacterium]